MFCRTNKAENGGRPGNLGAFGEALSSALDVMAFTNDLNISYDMGGSNMSAEVKAPIIQTGQTVIVNSKESKFYISLITGCK